MKIRSAIPENGCLTFLTDGKINKNMQKTYAKHIRIRLLPEGGCVNKVVVWYVLIELHWEEMLHKQRSIARELNPFASF